MKKTTNYVDVEDDITAIIGKVSASSESLVVLVLPKRAVMLQSIVNMRLLKKAAEAKEKKLVLVTTESTILPLAGAAGLHVAKSLSSKPYLPKVAKEEEPDVEEIGDEEPKIDPSLAIGELAAGAAAEETIDLPDDELSEKPVEDGAEATTKAAKKKFIKVPSFDSFRKRLFLGIGLTILAVVLWFFGFVVLPKAHIIVFTETSPIATEFNYNASVKAKAADLQTSTLPTEVKEVKKTEVEKFTPTGQKNVGEKASGTMNLINCIDDGASHTIPAGTGFSSGSLTFVTTSAVTLQPALYSGFDCDEAAYTTLGRDKDVAVSAASAGDSYNLSARSYTSSISGIKASGTAMSGGTSKIVKVVSQADALGARDKLLAKANNQLKEDIRKQLEATGNFAILDSFQVTQSELIVTPKVDSEATEGQASMEFSYSMYGVNKAALELLVTEKAKAGFDQAKQNLVDSGLKTAEVKVLSRPAAGELVVSFRGTPLAGPILDADALIKEILGKKLGATEKLLKERPGIKDVKIDYDPFWVFSTPRAASKITINFETSQTDEDNVIEP